MPSRLKVEPVRNSRLVTISFEGRDPVLIAQIVNSLAEAYMNRTIELKLNAAQTAGQWLREMVGEERKKIEKAEWALQVFRERENILSPQGGEEILVKKIVALNDIYVQTRVKRLEMESQMQMLQRVAKDPKMLEAFARDAKPIHPDPQGHLCHAAVKPHGAVGPVWLQASRLPA
jgi:uncharacterized protein involved in exopolysaccharide biosynthesis